MVRFPHGPAAAWIGDARHGSWALWCDETGLWFAAKRARIGEGVLAPGEVAPVPAWVDSGVTDLQWGSNGEEEK